jgi:uncharacterized membrane protein HdeD (DUF308 family)
MLSIDRWWVVALRGATAGLFGLLALLTPGLTLGLLVSMFGLWALVDGGLALLAAASPGRFDRARLLLVEGGIGTAIGVLVLLWPGITVLVLLLLAAIRAIGTGVAEALVALQLRRGGQGERLLEAAAASSVVVGALLLLLPSVAMRGTLWLLALHAIVFGALLAILALRLRALARGRGAGDRMVATT